MTAAAPTKTPPDTASAHSPPNKPTRTPASGDARSVAITWPLLSSPLARSQRCRGARIGNSERAPAQLNGFVSDEIVTIAQSSGGGSECAADKAAIEPNPTAATA